MDVKVRQAARINSWTLWWVGWTLEGNCLIYVLYKDACGAILFQSTLYLQTNWCLFWTPKIHTVWMLTTWKMPHISLSEDIQTYKTYCCEGKWLGKVLPFHVVYMSGASWIRVACPRKLCNFPDFSNKLSTENSNLIRFAHSKEFDSKVLPDMWQGQVGKCAPSDVVLFKCRKMVYTNDWCLIRDGWIATSKCLRETFCQYVQNTSSPGLAACLSAFRRTSSTLHTFNVNQTGSQQISKELTYGKENAYILRTIPSENWKDDNQSPDMPIKCLRIQMGQSGDNILQMGKNYSTTSLSRPFYEFKWTFGFCVEIDRHFRTTWEYWSIFCAPNIPRSQSKRTVLLKIPEI